MALETATYISDLVSTNPTSSDNMSQGDDHLRLLKSTIKATFPNVSGAVTPTHVELNYVDGVTSAIQTQLDTKAPLANPTFTGTVVLPSTTSVGNVSATEIGYLDGVTSAIQTQLDGKAASSHTHLAANITDLGSLATLNAVGTAQISDNAVTGAKIALGSDAQGDIMYYNGTDWARLGAGTAGQVLKTNGAAANPEWTTLAAASGIGDSQSWQTPARSNGTSYQNTTGKPIQVVITGSTNGSTNPVEVSTNNSTWVTIASVTSDRVSVSFIVPNGHYYRANSSVTIHNWAELR